MSHHREDLVPKQLQKSNPQEQFLESKKLRGKGQPRQLSSEIWWPQNPSRVDTERILRVSSYQYVLATPTFSVQGHGTSLKWISWSYTVFTHYPAPKGTMKGVWGIRSQVVSFLLWAGYQDKNNTTWFSIFHLLHRAAFERWWTSDESNFYLKVCYAQRPVTALLFRHISCLNISLWFFAYQHTPHTRSCVKRNQDTIWTTAHMF